MGIAVEAVQPVEAAEHEPEDRLARQVPFLLAPRGQLVVAGARDQLARQDPARRQVGTHGRDVDERMARERLAEAGLAGGFQPVVELVGEAGPQLLDQGLGVKAREHHARHGQQRRGVGQVGPDGVVDAGILHLDGDRHPVSRDGPVDLADRGGRDRRLVPGVEQPVRRGAQLLLDHPGGQGRGHGRGVLLQRRQGVAHRFAASRRRGSWPSGPASSGRPSWSRGCRPPPGRCAAGVAPGPPPAARRGRRPGGPCPWRSPGRSGWRYGRLGRFEPGGHRVPTWWRWARASGGAIASALPPRPEWWRSLRRPPTATAIASRQRMSEKQWRAMKIVRVAENFHRNLILPG